MKYIPLFILFLGWVRCDPVSPEDECSSEEIRCKTVESAINCDSVDSCLHVWRRNSLKFPRILPVVPPVVPIPPVVPVPPGPAVPPIPGEEEEDRPGGACWTCKTFAQNVLNYWQMRPSRKYVKYYMRIQCKTMMDYSSMIFCRSFMRIYFHMVVHMIARGYAPDLICMMIRQCESYDTNYPPNYPQNNEQNLIANTLQSHPLSLDEGVEGKKKKKKDEDENATREYCQACIESVDHLRNALLDPRLQASVDKFCRHNLCPIDKEFKVLCKDFMKEEVAEVFRKISDIINSEQLCNRLQFCTGNCSKPLQGVNRSLSCEGCSDFLKELKSLLIDKDIQVGREQKSCLMCKKAVQDMRKKLIHQEYVDQVKTWVDTEMCPLDPLSELLCRRMTSMELAQFLNLLVRAINPDDACRFLGECQLPVKALTTSTVGELEPYQEDVFCSFCLSLMTRSQQRLEDPTLDAQILDFLKLTTCPSMRMFAPECSNLVDAYAPLVFQKFAQTDPAALCRFLKSCSAQSVSRLYPYPYPFPFPPVRPDYSYLCKMVIKRLHDYIASSYSQDRIESLFRTYFCPLLRNNSVQCSQFVHNNFHELANLVGRILDENMICQRRPAWDEWLKSVLPVRQVSYVNGYCSECKVFLEVAKKILESKNSQKIAHFIINGVCVHLGLAQEMCTRQVTEYTPKACLFIVSHLDPDGICVLSRFCNNSMHKGKFHVLCPICKYLTEKANEKISDQQNQDNIKSFFKTTVCPLFATMQVACSEFSEKFLTFLFDFLEATLEDNLLCRLHLCPHHEKDAQNSHKYRQGGGAAVNLGLHRVRKSDASIPIAHLL